MIAAIYKIKLVSQPSSVVIVIIVVSAFLGSAYYLFPQLEATPKTFFLIGYALLSYFLWQKFVTGRTEWTISTETIKIVWIKRPLERTKNITIESKQIHKVSKGQDRNYYHLKIHLKSGETISFFHDHLTTKDDFEQLIFVLKQQFP